MTSANSMFEPDVVAELRKQFDEFDKDGSGQLNADEACKLFARKSIPDASEDEIRKMADNLRNQIDLDGSGTISFDEYCFRFGRRCQMDLRKRRANESTSTANSNRDPSSESDAAAELRREREAAAREREALQREREALRREREELNRTRSPADSATPEHRGDTSQIFPPGTRVEVRGLQGAQELNGKFGNIIRFEASSSRYVVQLEGGAGQKSLKADNLTIARGGTSGVSRFLGDVKNTLKNGLANVTVMLAGYEWWQIALGLGFVIVVVGAWWQQSARYGNLAARNSEYRRATSPFEDDYGYSGGDYAGARSRPDATDHGYSGGDYGGARSRPDATDFDDGSQFGGRRHGQNHRHYAHHDEDYGYGGYDAGSSYSSGGGGMFGDNGQLYTILIVGGLAYACWKGIIPVHQMSWFQLYMLWNMISPLIYGGRGGGFGGGYRRRRGFGGGLF